MWNSIDRVKEPFRWMAHMLNTSEGLTYSQLEAESGRARSQAWWNNLVRYGAWEPERARVGPPPPEAIAGIANLFYKSEKEVREMIAADWYDIRKDPEVSARVRAIEEPLNKLSEADAKLVEALVRSLAQKERNESEAA